MAWRSRARSSAARIAPSKGPPHVPYGCEGAHGTRRFRSQRIRRRVHSAGDTQPREERRHGSDTTQGGREATGSEEAGEPSEGRASSDPTCEEREEPAGRQAWHESARARLTDQPLAARRRGEGG